MNKKNSTLSDVKNFVCVCIFFAIKAELQVPKFEFFRLIWSKTADKFAIHWKILPKLDFN